MPAHDPPTLSFYRDEAAAYGTRADSLAVPKHLAMFVAELPKFATVLDLGCGTGRDTRALIDAGLTVTAVEGSAE
ncbi:MAG: class I SAM-dependent methyltransferase, partial [Alphaproteobacteria bacterium]|nr:class I SAM-dependent methyltransferase [Alphaproteobacteria bacterium]